MIDRTSDTVVVTGGKGFFGSHIVDHLRSQGYGDVAAVGSGDYDLTSADAVGALYRDVRPAAVVHAAAAVGGIGANKEQPGWFSYANTVMGANVLEGARTAGCEKVVLIGTICVYPGEAAVPTPESAMFEGFPAADTAAYGIAKRNLWMMGKAYREQYGLDVSYLIPTNLYGPRDHFQEHRSHVIPALIRRFVDARDSGDPEVVVWGDGTATREFIYVADAAQATVRALELYSSVDPLNVGTGHEVPVRELVELISSVVGYEGAIRWDPEKPSGAPRRSLDVTRLRDELGFQAETELGVGLQTTYRWYTEHRSES